MQNIDKYLKHFSKSVIGGTISINDLKDRELSGLSLSMDEKKAIVNYDSFRIKVLNEQKDDKSFHNKYLQLQVMANLSPYDEFLKEQYHSK